MSKSKKSIKTVSDIDVSTPEGILLIHALTNIASKDGISVDRSFEALVEKAKGSNPTKWTSATGEQLRNEVASKSSKNK